MLTCKQLSFVQNKLEGLSNRTAVLAAGYSAVSSKQRGTCLMRHPAIRDALARRGFDFKTPRHFAATAFCKNAGIWRAVAPSMPKAVYDQPEEFLLDAMNCHELPLEVRAEFAAALLPYYYKKL